MSDAMDALRAHLRQTAALEQVMGRLGWDQETVMPAGAGEQRAEETAALESVLHARRTDPVLGDLLEAARPADDASRRMIELARRDRDRSLRVPADLAAEIARSLSRAQRVWAAARAAEDFDAFAPTLDRVLDLMREKGAAIADGGDPYDALLQDYEPDMSAAELDEMFGALRPRLVALRERILGADRRIPELEAEFDPLGQTELSNELARVFGYDFERGRIDTAVHPFSSGSGQDVRITTRVSPRDPWNCLYSTVHEVGHACYEQNVDDAHFLTPLGRGVSMGVHESQSRIYENQLGRSRAFLGWLHGRMTETFGDFGIADPDTLHAVANRVAPGFIRTAADEVHYNLHVLLRFDIERELIAGRLAVADLPEAWNARFETDFGVAVTLPSDGCLQDVHWSVGLFGYFPTYTLGNVYAGCLHEAIRAEIPDLDEALGQGDPSPATSWLARNVQRHGALIPARDLIAQATGKPPSEAPLLDYLEAKFGAIYGL